jgi:FkbH-like protein
VKLVEALKAIQATPIDARPLPLHIVCGFTPLHLQTFLAAHVQALAPMRRVVASSGLFGDCLGNLERLGALQDAPAAAVVVLEWSDFDPRLGLRSFGGWRPSDLADITQTVRRQTERFAAAIDRVAKRVPLRVCLPTLPLPPVSYFPGARSSSFDLDLRAKMLELGAHAAESPNVALVNPQRLDRISPLDQRRDIASDLSNGFPYTLGHASAVGRILAELVVPAVPKKGLITDLDDTLWRGLIGEVGPNGISWDLDHKSHAHALYQQMLGSLAETGVLIAVASKNDPAAATQAFEVREELGALRGRFFPMEISWGPKSEAIGRILRAWNVGADSVVFVDDSPLELAEVQAAWPDVTCLRFPKESDAQVYALLEQLRDLFGKASVSTDDALRLESLRQAERFREEVATESADPNEFLSQLDAELTLSFGKEPLDPRALELINKTNQFNLNGRRYTDGDWLAYLNDPRAWLVTVAYKDKFGPLGTIGVIAGRGSRHERAVSVDAWVLSCRAFSRRIEHACVKAILARFDAAEIAFDFTSTAKNGPLKSFFLELIGKEPDDSFTLPQSVFESACPPLYHRLKELPHA